MKTKTPIRVVLLLLASCLSFSGSLWAMNDTATPQQVPFQRVNINKADISTLSSLKGIGHRKALAIVDYRENIAEFKSIDDLLYVKGIGEKVLANIKDKITL